ncbi:molybdopterin molybdotransferase MoeA [Kibdelosporangium philippinense]|uniref:Molybdopterin molybdenumtransferase n=1 Tax=Kibdelosporangium philippinense TaxID=211113 RepID=A0ABS8ZNK2_9PSEU|nr:gephyrin-like molybdotransferase Glp [Kibdelosporangium philippinense]MCE7009127.1 molybdopterin molybdotransferase MoeA [Kibdelosporangium philippinense]
MPNTATRPRSVDSYRATIAALVTDLPIERLPVADCLGLVLAEDVTAPIALPPFDNSAMDGYAVRSVDVVGASEDNPVELPVSEDIPAGRTDVVPLLPGTAHRIMTGAPVPPGADTVVQVELTDSGVEHVRIFAAVALGTHLRRTGEDVREGSTVMHSGTVLGPAQLGFLAALGLSHLPVRRRPRVLILSTGTELVEPGKPLTHGQIYESNSVHIAAAVEEIGGVATVLRSVPDDVEALYKTLEPHLHDHDLLVTTGGVSAGAYEVVKDALAGEGVEFLKVAVQPGGPQGFGTYMGLPVVTLPGNPVSAALSFELFVRPALLRAMGRPNVDRKRVTAKSTAAMKSPAGKKQYRRGFHEAGSVQAVPVGGPGSHLLMAFAQSNCLIEIPEDVTEVAEGGEVQLLMLAP